MHTMDYNHIYTNSAGNMTPTFGSKFSHGSSFYSEPYVKGNDLFVNKPSFDTPKCSRFSNFSTETCPPSVKNRYVRYHSYKPRCLSFQEADYRVSKECHDWSYCPETQGKCSCCSPKMHPNTGRGNCHGISNRFKSNIKKKSRKLPNSKPQGNFSATPYDNNHQTNYSLDAIDNSRQTNSTANASVHYVPNDELSVKIIGENECKELPTANKQKHFASDWSCETNLSKRKTSMTCASETENMNSTSENIGFNPVFQNDPLLNNNANELEASTDLLLTAMRIAGISPSQLKNDFDLSTCQTSDITISENNNSNIQNTQQDNLDFTDIESSCFKSVFAGKDENGQDIVILLADPEMQNIANNEVNADTLSCNENSNTGIYQNIAFNLIKSNLPSNQTSSEFPFGMPQVKQDGECSQDVFFSHIGDHSSEESVLVGSPKSKKYRKENDINADRNLETTVKQAAVVSDVMSTCVSEPSTSRKFENISKNTAQNFYSSGRKFNSRKVNRRWKRRFQRKSNEPFFNIQRQYFGEFVKRAKMENQPLMTDERFWKLYRFIVNKIGGSVMGAIYNMLPVLVHHYEASMRKVHAN